MKRKPFLAGNWKMHLTRAEARRLAEQLKASLSEVGGRDVAVAPPFTALATVGEVLAGSSIALAAQNLHEEPKGAYTGEISGPMLVDLGCRYVIIGHSERRQYFSETDEAVNRKIRAALAVGLAPIVCVGETLSEREAGRTLTVVERQVRGALRGYETSALEKVTLAYEPVWAIGTGRTATPEQAEEVQGEIRKILARIGGPRAAEQIRILYGGSVKPDNIDALMAQPDIDGALVGGASLDAGSFARIVKFREL